MLYGMLLTREKTSPYIFQKKILHSLRLFSFETALEVRAYYVKF